MFRGRTFPGTGNSSAKTDKQFVELLSRRGGLCRGPSSVTSNIPSNSKMP